MVLYGIKVKKIEYKYKGKTNALYHIDICGCLFSRMIQYWRETWNERTIGITDMQFPFDFVQVKILL